MKIQWKTQWKIQWKQFNTMKTLDLEKKIDFTFLGKTLRTNNIRIQYELWDLGDRLRRSKFSNQYFVLDASVLTFAKIGQNLYLFPKKKYKIDSPNNNNCSINWTTIRKSDHENDNIDNNCTDNCNQNANSDESNNNDNDDDTIKWW